jgi:hypothetical protein
MSNQPPEGLPEGGNQPPEQPFGQQPEPPQYGQQTPSYGDQPPTYSQQTPSYGNQPPAYGQGQPIPGAPQSNSPLAIVSLVTGILGIPCCGCFVFSIVAAITGFIAKKQIAESGGTQKGASLAQWGFILGLVGFGLGALITILRLANVIDGSFTFDQSGFNS